MSKTENNPLFDQWLQELTELGSTCRCKVNKAEHRPALDNFFLAQLQPAVAIVCYKKFKRKYGSIVNPTKSKNQIPHNYACI